MNLLTIYIYNCKDQTTRQRCRRHIERTGPYSPVSRESLIKKFETGDPDRCIHCFYERIEKERRTAS